ncbi:hypothetical protein HOD29_02710 [archaeon]|jgi:hypothetical protein|nr:hypothetical protein [archaeon]
MKEKLTNKFILIGSLGGFIGLGLAFLCYLFLGTDTVLIPIASTLVGLSFGLWITAPKEVVSGFLSKPKMEHIFSETIICSIYFLPFVLIFIQGIIDKNFDTGAEVEEVYWFKFIPLLYLFIVGIVRVSMTNDGSFTGEISRRVYQKSKKKYWFYQTVYYFVNMFWYLIIGAIYITIMVLTLISFLGFTIILTISQISRIIRTSLIWLQKKILVWTFLIVVTGITIACWFLFKDRVDTVTLAIFYSLLCGVCSGVLTGIVGLTHDSKKPIPAFTAKWYNKTLDGYANIVFSPIEYLWENPLKTIWIKKAKEFFN